jgi:serine/threonine protein kinase
MAENKTEKWTEIEHLPEWDEEFYDVYTAKKYGKWLMLKTLKPELRDNPRFKMLIEKEFDVRYNLCHPNIVMINDFEEVPGLGMCIITDDVYGDSLRKLIDKGEVNENILEKIVVQLPEAIAYIQKNHIVHDPIRPETIIFTENIRNLKLINVGFDQREHLTPTDASEDIRNYGLVLRQAMEAAGNHSQRYNRVVERCLNGGFRDVQDLKMALAGDSNMRLYITIIAFLSLMTIILGWLCWVQPVL